MNRNTQTNLSRENRGLSSITASNLLNKNSWETLSESTDIFFKSLELGRVRGVVSIVDFPNLESRNNSKYMQLVQEMLERDILVIVSSEEAGDINETGMIGACFFQNTGDGLAEFCDFIGIQPVMYIDSTIDKSCTLDFYKGLAQRAAVEIPDLPTAVIAADSYQLQAKGLGSIFTIKENPAKTADIIDEYIHDKRLGIQWCDRCGGRFSPFS